MPISSSSARPRLANSNYSQAGIVSRFLLFPASLIRDLYSLPRLVRWNGAESFPPARHFPSVFAYYSRVFLCFSLSDKAHVRRIVIGELLVILGTPFFFAALEGLALSKKDDLQVLSSTCTIRTTFPSRLYLRLQELISSSFSSAHLFI